MYIAKVTLQLLRWTIRPMGLLLSAENHLLVYENPRRLPIYDIMNVSWTNIYSILTMYLLLYRSSNCSLNHTWTDCTVFWWPHADLSPKYCIIFNVFDSWMVMTSCLKNIHWLSKRDKNRIKTSTLTRAFNQTTHIIP